MKILFLSNASLANGFVVGSHQLAKTLLKKGHSVSHISTPVSLIHVLNGKYGRAKFFYALSNEKKKNTRFGFFDHIPITLTPLGYSKFFDKINFWLINRQIRKIAGENVDLVLIDQPMLHPSLALFENAKKFYRPTDLYTEMAEGGPRFEAPEKECIEKVAGVISTSAKIDQHISTLTNKPRLTVNNGVDYDLFRENEEASEVPTETASGCVYIGALDFRFDYELAKKLAHRFPDIQFDYFGPVVMDIDSAELPDNIRFPGSIPYEQIPAILRQYKISIIPLNTHPANEGRSPMKLYEFLAAGLPVLSRKTQAVSEEVQPGILLYENYHDVENKFKQLIEQSKSTDVEVFKNIAYNESWDKKAEQILTYCQSLNAPQA